jgi:hypothetical protein
MNMLQKNEIDFNSLFEFWACTGLHIHDFAIGIEVDDDITITNVMQSWPAELKDRIKANPDCPPEWKNTAKAKPTGCVQHGDILLTPFKRKIKSLSAIEVLEPEDNLTPKMSAQEIHETLTQKIIRWRESQAIADWRTAERLRRYIVSRLVRVEQFEQENNYSALDTQGIRQIAAAMVDLQKMQRLALGLSSENIGFPLTGVSQGGEQIPIVNFNATDGK